MYIVSRSYSCHPMLQIKMWLGSYATLSLTLRGMEYNTTQFLEYTCKL
uniref:Uncharacterized protein n=1 Tax=Arundo donax TaxID=35708 RepID=A0A0A9C6J9_ARUDO